MSPATMPPVQAWLLAARPKTLPAALAPVAAGTALGYELAGTWHPGLALSALLSCLCLQIATNFFNDAIDHVKGADTEQRLGPRRVTASGDLTKRQVIIAALAFLGLASLAAFPLILTRGWPILAIGIPSLYLCYGYTGGPVPLAYRGLGELFVLLFFGWIAVMGSCYVQTGSFHREAFLLGTQVGLLSTALIAINNLRDRDEDRMTGKRTLAVRFGEATARTVISLCLAGPILLGCLWLATSFPAAAWWPVPALILSGFLIARIWREPPGPRYNHFLALSALHLLLTTGLIIAGILA